jgi:hypothetical protein
MIVYPFLTSKSVQNCVNFGYVHRSELTVEIVEISFTTTEI